MYTMTQKVQHMEHKDGGQILFILGIYLGVIQSSKCSKIQIKLF